MPRKNLGKKIDVNGNLEDLGNTLSNEDLEKLDNLSEVAISGSYNDLLNKPAKFLGTFSYDTEEGQTLDDIEELKNLNELLKSKGAPGENLIEAASILHRLNKKDFFDITKINGASLTEDLKSRDLTINSLAINLKTLYFPKSLKK